MSSIHNITPTVMAMHDELQDDRATIARTSSMSQRSISSSITEKQASVPATLPDEAVHASKKDADHEYRKYTLDTLTTSHNQKRTQTSNLSLFFYFHLHIRIQMR